MELLLIKKMEIIFIMKLQTTKLGHNTGHVLLHFYTQFKKLDPVLLAANKFMYIQMNYPFPKFKN